MAILVFVEGSEGRVKITSLEALSYAHKFAGQGGAVSALLIGDFSAEEIQKVGNAGAAKILQVKNEKLNTANTIAYTAVVEQATKKENADLVIMARSALNDPLAARLASRLQASLATNVVALPVTSGTFKVKRSIYTGKAFVTAELKAGIKILTIKKNATDIQNTGNTAQVEVFEPTVSDADFSVKTISVEKAQGDVLLPEADIVVSGGRGLKGPENWGMIEQLAKVLGAATACSKPVSDLEWRPHHEHVGQTGIKISPSLYIAVGISGAIQHLAGVNSSKIIVAINKDPEAPFFKAADYGIVGDAFEVVPKLTEAFKASLN